MRVNLRNRFRKLYVLISFVYVQFRHHDGIVLAEGMVSVIKIDGLRVQ